MATAECPARVASSSLPLLQAPPEASSPAAAAEEPMETAGALHPTAKTEGQTPPLASMAAGQQRAAPPGREAHRRSPPFSSSASSSQMPHEAAQHALPSRNRRPSLQYSLAARGCGVGPREGAGERDGAGLWLGFRLGRSEGRVVVGAGVGGQDGRPVGPWVGRAVGRAVGMCVGRRVGPVGWRALRSAERTPCEVSVGWRRGQF